MKNKEIPAALAVLALFSFGCAVGPDFKTPEAGAPGAFLAGGAPEAPVATNWFAGFNDALLDALLETARTNNLGVKQAMQRVRASRAALAGSKAEFWPQAGFSAGASKSKSFDPDETSERASLGFDASWELDLFGKIRRGVEASKAELAATEISLEDALLSLDAEVAAEYVNLRLLQRQYQIATNNLALQKDFYAIAKSKFDAGLTSERDCLSSEAQLHSTEASLPEAQAAIAACMRRIETLLALNPGALDAVLSATAPVPNAPEVALTVPSALLRRRPDIRKSEKSYAAALARIGVAKASYYPSVSIGAGASLSSSSFSDWGDAMKTLNFGPSVNWNILSFGRTKARVEQARAAADEAALAYRETVLRAVHEVETTATNLGKDIARAEPLAKSEAAQRKALDLSRQMYEQDLGEYQEVISAQQAYLSASRTLAESAANISLSKISLYKALGGGY